LLYNVFKPLGHRVRGFTPTHKMFIRHLDNIQKNMNKADIINKVHEELGITKVDAEKAVETVMSCIVETLSAGQEVSIAGLGIFSAKMRNARTARNPRTGEPIEVPAMRVPKFRAAKALKDAVRG